MGWWEIKDVETGQINFGHKQHLTNSNVVNAIPGKERIDSLYNGDGPADLMGSVLQSISKQYEKVWGRPAKKDELTAVFNFCCNGMFR